MAGSKETPSSKRRSTKKSKKKFEFSKLIIIVVGSVSLLLIGFTLAIIWKTGDTTPLAYLIPAVFAELATATGFYYNKAKAENRIKIAKSEGLEYVNQTGIDQL